MVQPRDHVVALGVLARRVGGAGADLALGVPRGAADGGAMTTIPLAPVVAFLCLRGLDPANVLEGAPYVRAGRFSPYMALMTDVLTPEATAGYSLYLGSDDICPAALGWAAVVLGIAFGAERPCVLEDAFNDHGGSLCLWSASWRLDARWTWTSSAMGRTFREVQMDGERPPTPAARLLAVLEHEIRRGA